MLVGRKLDSCNYYFKLVPHEILCDLSNVTKGICIHMCHVWLKKKKKTSHEYVPLFYCEFNWDSLWMGCLFDWTIPMTNVDNAIGFEMFIYHLTLLKTMSTHPTFKILPLWYMFMGNIVIFFEFQKCFFWAISQLNIKWRAWKET